MIRYLANKRFLSKVYIFLTDLLQPTPSPPPPTPYPPLPPPPIPPLADKFWKEIQKLFANDPCKVFTNFSTYLETCYNKSKKRFW